MRLFHSIFTTYQSSLIQIFVHKYTLFRSR